MFSFKRKYIIFSFTPIFMVPIFLTSCSSVDNSIQNKFLDEEINESVSLTLHEYSNLENVNLLNVASDNSILINVFDLPKPKILINNEKEYKIWYSWNLSKKNIVSFENNGNILFEVDINCGLSTSNVYATKQKQFRISIEEDMISEDEQDSGAKPNIKALRYYYNEIKFQSIRKDIFEKSVIFNLDFYSKNTLINNRPVIIKSGATKETAIDAYSRESLISYPELTLMNNTRYRFGIESADFDELNPKKGIYKIRVSPETNDVFNNDVISYAKTKGISFDKFYYFYEKNTTFKYPTESNISTHKRINTEEADRIGLEATSSVEAFKPKLKNNSLIIGVKSAKEIVKINKSTPGGIFTPPIFHHQYSIDPFKEVVFSIDSISADDSDLNLIFSLKISVGNKSPFIVTNSVNKTISIKNLL